MSAPKPEPQPRRPAPRRPVVKIPKAHPHTGKDGRVRARLRIPGQRDLYLGAWGSVEALEAERRAVAEYLAAQAGGVPTAAPSRGASLATLLVAFAQYAEAWYRDGSQPTGELYHYRGICPIMHAAGGDILASAFGVSHLLECRRQFVARGWARTHVNEQVSRVRRVIRKGVEWGYVPAAVLAELRCVSPLIEGKTTAPESEPTHAVDDETILRTLPHVGASIASMILVERLTGMRPGEVVQLRAGDLDRTADPAGACWLYAPHKHKTKRQGKDRRIWLGALVQRILAPLIAAAEERDTGGYLFPPTLHRRKAKTPGHYLVSSYQRRIKEAVARRNRQHPDRTPLEAWSPNALRHARLTAVVLEHGILAAQATGSHSHLNTTQIYSHHQDELARQAAAALGGDTHARA